ncbi:MAG: hypothetical protein QOH36_5 [Actinomycetota bacterium]|nr:hypothetical protein [Actinomycetota bacterium]MEA2972585.1 hypothetical protein [Actinomycetota bacterium]
MTISRRRGCPRHVWSRNVVTVLAVALLMVTAACGGGKKGSQGRATTIPATTTTTLPPQAPLTGLPQTDPVKLHRAAVTVKIDNNAAARPQAGLDAADVVYEEVTEGITRFVVVFQSTDADPIGPVRSVRPADPLIVAPLGGPLVFSGGAPTIVQLVRSAGIDFIDENNTEVLYRRSGRSAPHNLYTDSGKFYAAVGDVKEPPPFAPFLKPGETYAAAGATPVTAMDIPLADITASYTWDATAKGWARSTNGQPHTLEAGGVWTPGNVIVQFVGYSRFSADAAVTYPEVIGTGEAWYFTNGTLAKGTWSKAGASTVTAYADANGAPMVFPPGHNVVELVHSEATVSVEEPPAPAAATTVAP